MMTAVRIKLEATSEWPLSSDLWVLCCRQEPDKDHKGHQDSGRNCNYRHLLGCDALRQLENRRGQAARHLPTPESTPGSSPWCRRCIIELGVLPGAGCRSTGEDAIYHTSTAPLARQWTFSHEHGWSIPSSSMRTLINVRRQFGQLHGGGGADIVSRKSDLVPLDETVFMYFVGDISRGDRVDVVQDDIQFQLLWTRSSVTFKAKIAGRSSHTLGAT